ncbi:MAG TPA: YCF48-related protein, partial [Thermoanaerobaculia bacterium]|nr:YCF48-related protein [Thermoanaerobaculia bacterium]
RGTFYSTDLGSTWKRTGKGVAASRIRSLASAGVGERILVAGLENCTGGIARTSDGGNTWQLIDTRVRGQNYGYPSDVQVVASAPSLPGRVYAVSGDSVLRSDNGGASWEHFHFADGISGGASLAIAVHPTDPDLIFIAGGHGLSRSADGGRTWSGGLSEYPFNNMTTVAFEPGHPDRMLSASSAGGLFRSTDTGAHWQLIPGTETRFFQELAFDPRHPNVVLGRTTFENSRILRSTDGGTTWDLSDDSVMEGFLTSLAYSPDGTAAVAGGDEGVYLSRDGGQTWIPVEGAPTDVSAILPQANGTLRIGTLSQGVASSPSILSP